MSKKFNVLETVAGNFRIVQTETGKEMYTDLNGLSELSEAIALAGFDSVLGAAEKEMPEFKMLFDVAKAVRDNL